MTALATIEDVEAVITRATTVEEQGFIPRLIEMMSERVANELRNISWAPVADESVTITPHDGVLRLPKQPVTAVTSVTISGSLIDPTEYRVTEVGILERTSPLALAPDSTWGILTGPGNWPLNGSFPWPPAPTVVVYDHGYSIIPGDVALVVAELVAAKIEAGAAQAAGVMTESISTGSTSYSATYAQATGEAWSPEHDKILDRYRRTKVTSVRLG